MKDNGRFYYWGPLLFRVTLSPEDIQALKNVCNEARLEKKDHNKKLVGIIKEELLINSEKYTEIVKPYLEKYQMAYQNYHGKKFKHMQTESVWVNYMKKGEFNPPHNHTRCNLSSVLYLEIPPGLKKENEEFIGQGFGPGSIHFIIAGPQPLYNNAYGFRPKVGDFFIFPWCLTHTVAPFKCKGTRISVAANFTVSAMGEDGNLEKIPAGWD